MKKTLQKALFLSVATASMFACNRESVVVNTPDESNKLVRIEVGASQEQNGPQTKASYSKAGLFSWEAGDSIFVGYEGQVITGDSTILPTYNYSCLSTVEDGKTVYFNGDMIPFEYEKTLSAFHFGNPNYYSECYETVDLEDRTVLARARFFNAEGKTAGVDYSVNDMSMGMMVAVVDSAYVTASDDYSIPALNFSQVASFLQFEITDHPTDRYITYVDVCPEVVMEGLTSDDGENEENLNPDDFQFITEARVSLESGEITEVLTKRESAGGEFYYDADGENKLFTLAMFPVATTGKIFLLLEVEKNDGEYAAYKYELGENIEFKRNTIHRKYAISWNDLTEVIFEEVTDPSTDAGSGTGEDANVEEL